MNTTKFKSLFKKALLVRDSGQLEAGSVKNLYVYGSLDRSEEKELQYKIKSIEDEIVREASSGRRLLTRIYGKEMIGMSEHLMQHFKEKGFVANIHKEEGIEDFHILVIGW